MTPQRFKATFNVTESRRSIELPFDPNEVWGAKERHHVTGSIDDHPIRGCPESIGGRYVLSFGPSWNREREYVNGETVEVELTPEGPQVDALAPDIADSLRADPEARAFFESLATFYRKGFIDGIESAKRSETRSKRITEMMECLRAGKKQR